MSSFKRKSTLLSSSESSSQSLQSGGLRPSPGLATNTITSSGIASLDDILGGGIQLGTATAVLSADPHAAYNHLLLKYFIAQGLVLNQVVYVISNDGRELVDSCMWTTKNDSDDVTRLDDEDYHQTEEKVKIAWRYEHMKRFETTISSAVSKQSDDYCSSFDLACQIPASVVERVILSKRLIIDADTSNGDVALSRLKEFLESSKSQSTLSPIRIALPSFGGAWWGRMDQSRTMRLLLKIRQTLRAFSHACVMMTLPHYMCQDYWSGSGWLDKLGWSLDACIALNSFSADPSRSAHFPSHHGLVQILNLPRINVLVPASERFSTLRGLSVPSAITATHTSNSAGVGENNIAFKCTRRRLVFETFHLDVEGGVGERRTTPAPSGLMTEKPQPPYIGETPSGRLQPAVEVHVDLASRASQARHRDGVSTAKRVKKKVGFQVNKPDLYDF